MSALRSFNRQHTKVSAGDREVATWVEGRLASEITTLRAEMIAAAEQNAEAVREYGRRTDAALDALKADILAAIAAEKKERQDEVYAVGVSLGGQLSKTISYRLVAAWRAVVRLFSGQ
jgi:hypothetical protein